MAAASLFSRQFKTDSKRVAADLRHRGLIRTALTKYEAARDLNKAAFQDWQGARQAAAERKWEAINHLDRHLESFAAKLEARGTKVHWASTAAQARQIFLDILREKGARSIIKSKAMTAEEIHLNDALEKAGYSVVESDLGEYIVQLRNEAPYHIVFPAMHLTRGEISALFAEKLGTPPTDNPEDLTMIARRVLRDKYITADVGITGANFAVAETGMVSITENEGNARLTAALPRTMITLLGIEKIVPKLSDLALFLPMLATAGAGQAITGYNSMYGGPRQPGETDGPEEYHVVLIDNGRTHLLADPEQRDALHCIRCGACLNVCPIYRNVGGHSYGTTYSGPIGSVITPHLRGLQDWKHLSQASSLCGACTDACPVKIDLHHHLLQNRRNAMSAKPTWWERLAFRGFAFIANRALFLNRLMPFARFAQKWFHWIVKGGPLDPARVWTETRELPPIAPATFTDLWRARQRARRHTPEAAR
jgi:L-lactate dehydrogenase complex protein LldF